MMRLTIVGFGNQAKAWSQNLKDSGFPFRVALQPGSPSLTLARAMGLETVEIGRPSFFEDEAFALLLPDHLHHDFLAVHGKGFKSGTSLLYAHGFSVVKHSFEKIYPNLNHVLFAPKSIGTELRRQYQLKGKLGAVFSLEHAPGAAGTLTPWVLDLARALGINMGPYPTSFLRETQADLYSEQGLLCSLVPYAAGEMFTHLVDTGVEPELAYFECWLELKLIVAAMVDKGPEGFYDLISPNALIGAEKGYQRLITPEFKANLRSLLAEIQSGQFDRELDAADVPELRERIRSRWAKTPLMETFRKINREGT